MCLWLLHFSFNYDLSNNFGYENKLLCDDFAYEEKSDRMTERRRGFTKSTVCL